MLDYHVHLWPHAETADPLEHRLEELARYCEDAARRGVEEIALTEHFFRFRSARAVIDGFWDDEADPALRGAIACYFDHHATAELDDYVEAALAAKAAGLPVRLGLEVDYYPGQMDKVAALLAGYPFDVLLGSVHWLGTFMFDDLSSEVAQAEWARRGIEATWRAYADALGELAATRSVDVLAHPDLVKVAGHRPDAGLVRECEARIAEAAATSGMAAELSSAGWRKPAAEAYPSPSLLARFFERSVPLTTASDTHGRADVASRSAELAELAEAAGYSHLRAFSARQGRDVPLRAERGARAADEAATS
ncbi:MAG: PHP domain-containing protein [Actinomycetota bacterium]|nr:PHP domain-containing protein [Actinomycetota bacterium]